MGNVNLDYCLDINDATDIQKTLVNNGNANKFYRFLADVNGDGVVSILDATALQKALVA